MSGVHKPDANKWLITDRALKFVSKKLPKTLAEFASVEGIGKVRSSPASYFQRALPRLE